MKNSLRRCREGERLGKPDKIRRPPLANALILIFRFLILGAIYAVFSLALLSS